MFPTHHLCWIWQVIFHSTIPGLHFIPQRYCLPVLLCVYFLHIALFFCLCLHLRCTCQNPIAKQHFNTVNMSLSFWVPLHFQLLHLFYFVSFVKSYIWPPSVGHLVSLEVVSGVLILSHNSLLIIRLILVNISLSTSPCIHFILSAHLPLHHCKIHLSLSFYILYCNYALSFLVD